MEETRKTTKDSTERFGNNKENIIVHKLKMINNEQNFEERKMTIKQKEDQNNQKTTKENAKVLNIETEKRNNQPFFNHTPNMQKRIETETSEQIIERNQKQLQPVKINEISTYNRKKGKVENKKKRKKNKNKDKLSISIAYNNIQGKLNNEKQMLNNLAATNKWDVIGLTETHHKQGQKTTKLQGYNCFERNREGTNKKGGGLAIYIKNTFEAFEISTVSEDEIADNVNQEIMWLKITGTESCIIGLIYLASNDTDNTNDKIMTKLNEDTEIWKKETNNIIIMGDFNGHIHKDEGGPQIKHKTNRNGKLLIDYIKHNNLRLLNSEKVCQGTWTWMRADQKSVVDYILATEATDITEIRIDDTGEKWSIGSDHSWIVSKIKFCPSINTTKTKSEVIRWKIHEKSNWKPFTQKLKIQILEWEQEYNQDLDLENKLDSGYTAFINTLKQVADEVFGRKIEQFKTRKPQKVNKLIKQRNLAAKRWKKANKINNIKELRKQWNKLQTLKSKCRRKILKHKEKVRNDRWLNTKEKISNQNQQWKNMKPDKSQNIDRLLVKGKEITDRKEITTEIQQYLQELGKESRGNDPENINREIPQEKKKLDNADQNNLMKPISTEEVIRAIQNTKKGKAVGLDSIPNEFFKESKEVITLPLVKLFNTMLTIQQTPPDWGSERLTLLHKKGDRRILDNYRGISISSNIGKLFGRILEKRLSRILEDKQILSEMQNGFRPGRGTCDNIFILHNIMELKRQRNKPIYLAFIDLKKAYDRIWRKGLWECLKSYNLGEKFIKVIQQLYNNHKKKSKIIMYPPNGLTVK